MNRLLRRLRASIYLRRRQRALDARRAVMTYVLTTIGNISIIWSGLSLILNTFIEWNQDRLGTEFPRGMPRNFTAKLEHLKKVEKDEFWTAQQRAELRAIRLELARLNKGRVELFHGLVYMTGHTDDFLIHIAKEEGNELVRKTLDRTYAELCEFRNELAQMVNRLTDFVGPVTGIGQEA